MRYIGIIILLVLCLTLLLLTGCVTNTITPEIASGNLENQEDINQSSNNSQNSSTGLIYEPGTEEPATVEVDTTKPVITGSRAPLPNSFGWNNTDVTVTFSCADTGAVQSGIDKNTVAGKTLTTEGKNQSVTNTGTCIDVAGNTADPATVSNINIDKTPPVVTITLPGTGEYVLNQSITATWSATDALSGVDSPISGSVSIDTSSVGTKGKKTFTLPAGKAKDKAGNSSLKVTKSYSVIADEVDTTKPVITGSRAPLPNSFGWNNTDVTVTFSCADTGAVQSGIDKNTVAGKTLTTEGKNQSVTNTGTCIDVAGNTADPATVSNINIDKTPPVVTITLPGTGEYVLNQSITATWSATDALSGVDSPVSGSVSIDTSSVGTKTFTLPAGTTMDKAGNGSLEVTISYSVIADSEDPEMIYPQKWATGTGTSGDPWAGSCIEDAYNACPAGGTIYLRAGYYTLSDEVTITKQINIIGEGMNKTIIITANAHGFKIDGVSYVSIKNLTIDGDAQTDGTQYLACISISGLYADVDYIILEDIEAKNAGYYGIAVFQVNHSLFQNIHAHDNYRHGIHPGSNTVGRNQYNTYRDIYAWNNGLNGFDDRGDPTHPDEQCYNVYDGLNCWDNAGRGIYIAYQRGGVLSNSSTSSNALQGISLDDIEDFNIHDCLVDLEEATGLAINGSENVNFTDVITKNNNVVHAGEAAGIRIENSSNLRFTSCQSYDDRETKLQTYGMKTVTDTNYIELVNCTLTPNAIGAISNGAGALITVITEKMLARF